MLIKLSALALVALPVALLGPPMLKVAAGSPGEPLVVTVEHHDEVGHIKMTARQEVIENGRLRSTDFALSEAASTAHTRTFSLNPPRRDGVPVVVVVRGTHGEDGPFSEAMISIDARGAVIGIEYPKRKAVIGGFINPKVSDQDVVSTLRRMINAGG